MAIHRVPILAASEDRRAANEGTGRKITRLAYPELGFSANALRVWLSSRISNSTKAGPLRLPMSYVERQVGRAEFGKDILRADGGLRGGSTHRGRPTARTRP